MGGRPGTDRPGRELPKDYRKIATHLVDHQGWRYDRNPTGKHPVLYPPDPSKPQLRVPTTPGDRRALRNFISDVRRRGATWPP